MSRCKCGSYAINIHHHGRDGVSDLDLCDVCYWRKRAGGMIGHGSPSGVVEALAQQLARDIDACLTSTQIAERALALLATPPQAPAAPAAAPGTSATETPVTGRGPTVYIRGSSTMGTPVESKEKKERNDG